MYFSLMLLCCMFQSAALYGNTFGIDAYSGSITVKTELDYSKLKFYEYLIVGTVSIVYC